jgi:hypothetical protein
MIVGHRITWFDGRTRPPREMSVSSKIISTLLAVTAMTAASTTVLAAPAKKPTVAEAERFLADTESAPFQRPEAVAGIGTQADAAAADAGCCRSEGPRTTRAWRPRMTGAYGKAKYCPAARRQPPSLHAAGRNRKSAGHQPR